jgi:TetR/AcrR family transcriptional regulator, transcriptional repressor for nem operon
MSKSMGRSTRDELIDAAKRLFWERGYEGTSPRLIQQASNAGQGSFYHHFPGKIDLAQAALESITQEEIARLDELGAVAENPLALVLAYIDAPREAVRGCRLGRFAYEMSIEEPQINDPILGYFRYLQSRLAEALSEAQRQGLIEREIDPERTALVLVAIVQGAFVLARVHNDQQVFTDALRGARALIERCVTARPHDPRPARTRPARAASNSRQK